MSKWNGTYAYDVSCYMDFSVEAETEEEAEAIIEKALADDKFADVIGEERYDVGTDNHRVFISGPERNEDMLQPTLQEVIE